MGFLSRIPSKILELTRGRTTAFFIAFFLAGHAMAFLDKLTPTYIGFMGTLGGLVLGHSIKEDVMAAKLGPQGEPNADPKA